MPEMRFAGAGLSYVYRPNRHLRLEPRAALQEILQSGAAAIYCRTSDRKNKESSIDYQLDVCHAKVADLGLQTKAVLIERARSGASLIGRPVFERALSGAELGLWQNIVVAELDRMTRSETDVSTIRKRLGGTKTHIIDAEYGELSGSVLTFKAFEAEDERVKLVSRTRIARDQMLANGLIPYECVFGYCRDTRHPGLHEPHPVRAAWVEEIFDRAKSGQSDDIIAQEIDFPTPSDCLLIDAGLPPLGASWKGGMVRGVRIRPTYKGVVLDNRTNVKRDLQTNEDLGVVHMPDYLWNVTYIPAMRIVSDEVWAAAQMSKNYFAFTERHTSRNLLTGKAACGACGALLRRERRRTEFDDDGYVCSNGCASIGRPLITDAETSVLTAVAAMARAAPTAASTDIDIDAETILRLRTEYEALQCSLDADFGRSIGRTPSVAEVFDRERRERRAAAIRCVLEPSDEADPIDPVQLGRAIAAVVPVRESLLYRVETRILFEAVQRLVTAVKFFDERSRGRLEITLDRSAFSFVPQDVLVVTEKVAVATLEGRRTQRRASVKDMRAELVDHPAGLLPADVRDRLATDMPELEARLNEIDWSIASTLEASGLRIRAGVPREELAGLYGASASFWVAMAIVQTSGERYALMRSLVGAPELFKRGADALFQKIGAFWRLHPNVEAAMTLPVVAELRTARIPGARRDLAVRLADWLEAGRKHGVARDLRADDLQLTCALARIRQSGLSGLLKIGLGDAHALAAELQAADALELDSTLRRSIQAVVAHLESEKISNIARRIDENYYVVTNMVLRYRAFGVAGLLVGTRQDRRISAEQVGELVEIVRSGRDPRDTARPVTSEVLSQLCKERFGCLYGYARILQVLAEEGFNLSTAEIALPKSRHRKQTDVLTNVVFLDDDGD